MPINIHRTSELIETGSVKIIVYSEAGFGKTTLCATAPDPFIISTESGLLSLKNFDLPYTPIHSLSELGEAYDHCVSSPHQTICLDSISDIAETILVDNKKNYNDGRAAYGKLNDTMHEWITKFRDIQNKHVYFTAKQGRFTDEYTGITSYGPMMPGKNNQLNLPFYFDELFCLRIGTLENGETYRYLQTQPDISYNAKDRSGELNLIERPDLSKIFAKIMRKREDDKKPKVKSADKEK